LAGLGLKETLATRIATLRIGETLRGDAAMLGNLQYSAYLLVYGIAFGSLLGYYATTPYLFTRELGFASYQYGYLLIFNVVFYVAGAQCSRLATRRWGIERPLMLAMLAYARSTALFLVVELFAELDTLSVLIPMSVFIFGAGLVSPAANAGAMTIFREHAGAATAFVGFAVVIGSAVFSGALAHVDIRHLWQLGTYVGTITVVSSAITVAILRKPPAQA
jgi:hypothetical protein